MVPVEALQGLQPAQEGLLQGEQVTHIIQRVVHHGGSEWTFPPVGLLRPLLQGDTEVRVERIVESKAGFAHQASGQHRIKDPGGLEVMPTEQQSQVVVGSVEDDGMPIHGVPQRFEVQVCQGVHEVLAARHTDLKQAQFFRVSVQGVGLGIQSDPF